jgi:hypothetical protein
MNDERKFVPVKFAAHVAGRPERTIRTWARDGVVRQRDGAKTVEVHIGDAARASKDRARRRRLPSDGTSA